MKHAYLRVHVGVFLEFLKHGVERVRIISDALPADTKFVRAGHDQFGMLYLVLESELFKELKEGDELPELKSPVFDKVYK